MTNRIAEFIALHATCGEISQAWGQDSASFRCPICAATLTLALDDAPDVDALADLGDAVERLGLTPEEMETMADKRAPFRNVQGVFGKYPSLRALVAAQLLAQQRTIRPN